MRVGEGNVESDFERGEERREGEEREKRDRRNRPGLFKIK